MDEATKLIVAVLGGIPIGAIILALIKGLIKRQAEKNVAAIKEEQTAQKALLNTQIRNQAVVDGTISDLKRDLVQARSDTAYATKKSAEATEANALLRVDQQKLRSEQEADRTSIAELKSASAEVGKANAALVIQVNDLTLALSKANEALALQATELTSLRQTVAALSQANATLRLKEK